MKYKHVMINYCSVRTVSKVSEKSRSYRFCQFLRNWLKFSYKMLQNLLRVFTYVMCQIKFD